MINKNIIVCPDKKTLKYKKLKSKIYKTEEELFEDTGFFIPKFDNIISYYSNFYKRAFSRGFVSYNNKTYFFINNTSKKYIKSIKSNYDLYEIDSLLSNVDIDDIKPLNIKSLLLILNKSFLTVQMITNSRYGIRYKIIESSLDSILSSNLPISLRSNGIVNIESILDDKISRASSSSIAPEFKGAFIKVMRNVKLDKIL